MNEQQMLDCVGLSQHFLNAINIIKIQIMEAINSISLLDTQLILKPAQKTKPTDYPLSHLHGCLVFEWLEGLLLVLGASSIYCRSLVDNVNVLSGQIRYQTFMNQDNNPEQAPARLINYIEINHLAQEYRVVQDHYEEKKTNLALAWLVWAEIVIFTLLYLFLDRFYNQKSPTYLYLPLFIEVDVFAIIMLSMALLNRSSVAVFTFWSIVAGSLYVLAVTILFEKQIACQWIAAIAFSSVQIVLAIFCTKQKLFIVPIAFLAAQLILIAFKVEGRLSLNWLLILSVLIGVAFIQAAASLGLIIMGTIEAFKAEGYRLFAIETTYLGLVQLGYAVDAAAVVVKLAFNIPNWLIVAPCAGYNLFLLIYSFFFRQEIILFKSKAALILSQKNKYRFEKIQHTKILIKSSANWFNPHPEDEKGQPGEEKVPSSIKQQTKCVICLCDAAQMIWLPCGHLTVCDGCGQYLMDNGKLNCVICKTKGEELYHIKVDSSSTVPRFESDYYYKITVK